MAFASEQQMVSQFMKTFSSTFSSLGKYGLRTLQEVRVPGGIPDFILFRETSNSVYYVIAVEFKLSRWRRALNQAFRNRNFANESYVILDQNYSKRAVENVSAFKKANVGLITFSADYTLEFHHFPESCTPFSSRYASLIASKLLSNGQADTSNEPIFAKTRRGGLPLYKLRRIGSHSDCCNPL